MKIFLQRIQYLSNFIITGKAGKSWEGTVSSEDRLRKWAGPGFHLAALAENQPDQPVMVLVS